MAPQAVGGPPPAEDPGPDVVIEYVVRGRSPWGMRLRANGWTDEWTATAGWQPLVRIDPTEVAGFIDGAKRDGFLAVPEAESGDAADDATQLTWMIEIDGNRRRVTARVAGRAWNSMGLQALDRRLQLIVGAALNRVADAAAPRPRARRSDRS